MMSNMPLGVDEVTCRPILVMEVTPYRIVAVNCNRIANFHVLQSPTNVVDCVLERELGRVDADHHQAVIPVFLGPRPNIGEGASPIHAGIGPKVYHYNFPAKV